jgi:hypothetical protein
MYVLCSTLSVICSCYFLATRLPIFHFFMFVFLLHMSISLCVFCVLVLSTYFSPFVYCCFFSFSLQFYRPLPLGGHPITLNVYSKYHNISFPLQKNNFYIFHFMFSLPIPIHGTGLKVKQFILYFCMYVYIYSHTHYIYRGNKKQISVYLSPGACIVCRGS